MDTLTLLKVLHSIQIVFPVVVRIRGHGITAHIAAQTVARVGLLCDKCVV